MVVIDLFSGAGGLTEGFVREDFNIIAHIEKEKWACETLKTRLCFHYLKQMNALHLYYDYLEKSKLYLTASDERKIFFKFYPELEKIIEHEVLNLTFGDPNLEPTSTENNKIIKLIENSMKFNNVNNVDVIIGGPPCQAYSFMGRGRMGVAVESDKRNFLFYYYRDIVKHFKPSVFVFENVPGILSAKKGKIFESIQEEFDGAGYRLISGPSSNHMDNILDAKDFGVCQSRKRVILFGFRKDKEWSYPDLKKNIIFSNKDTTTRNAIEDLPFLKQAEGDDFEIFSYTDGKNIITDYKKIMREDSIGVINHKARGHINRDMEIYKIAIHLAEGGKQLRYWKLPSELKTHQNEKSFNDRFKVHRWDDVPHTIVAHISKDGHYNIHPDIEQCRSLTVREAARIQSFPDNYRFEGPRTSQFMQVGNAVPPLMAQAIARAVKKDLFSNI